MSEFTWNKNISFGKNMTNAYKSGDLDPAIGLLSTLTGSALSGDLSSGAGKVFQGLGNVANLIPGAGTKLRDAFNIAEGITNRLIGSQINDKAVQDMESANEAQSNMAFSATSNEDLLAQSNFGLLDRIKRSDVGKDGLFSNKAKNLTAKLNREREQANLQALANYDQAVNSLDTQNDLNILANYAANGGPIHIAPSKRGTFTTAAKKRGKSVQAFASQVLANKENYSPAMVKKANFAHVFGGRNYETGGYIEGKEYDLSIEEINRLKLLGYKIEYV